MSKQVTLEMFRAKRSCPVPDVGGLVKRTAESVTGAVVSSTAESSSAPPATTTTAPPVPVPDDTTPPTASSSASYADLTSLVPPAWRTALSGVIASPAWRSLAANLAARASSGEKIFPPPPLVFAALAACPPEDVRVVIIGQDPYHDDGQAEGLCFSVPKNVKKVPPSLKNMYKVLQRTLGADAFPIPAHGHLGSWAKQGVLLLNTALTVKAHEADSHKKVGWEPVTDAIVAALARQQKELVWLCWGAHAQKKAKGVSRKDHLVLETSHPSPLGASKGFLTCNHFVECNQYLEGKGKKPIQWRLE